MTNQPIKDKEFYLNSGNLFSDKVMIDEIDKLLL